MHWFWKSAILTTLGAAALFGPNFGRHGTHWYNANKDLAKTSDPKVQRAIADFAEYSKDQMWPESLIPGKTRLAKPYTVRTTEATKIELTDGYSAAQFAKYAELAQQRVQRLQGRQSEAIVSGEDSRSIQ